MRFLLAFLVSVTLLATGCGVGNGRVPQKFVGSASFPPAVTMLAPANAPVGSPGFTLTVVGSNFGSDTVVFWNGNPVSTTIVNSKEVMAQISTTNLQDAGFVPIFVRTGGQNSNTINFDVLIQ
ncbi:MAG TPA: IPT/TIG domain-containing protein [Terriglobales bacterium]|nr:IPT/TIG domain-containing protein [Terriglobales bacterium]